MELVFLGTGAGELWPSVFCPCADCRRAVAARGSEQRIGASLLVNRTFLFDLPPNGAAAAIRYGVSLADVTHLFVTHSHQDHFDPGVLPATGRSRTRPLHLHCNRRLAELLPVYQQFNRFFDPVQLGLAVHPLDPLDTVRAAAERFVLRALPADHDRTHGEEPLIFDFEHDGRRLLYACDTGPFPEATWAAVAGVRYDAVILECTFHFRAKCRQGHLDWENFLAVRRRLTAAGCLTAGTPVVAQHLSQGHTDASVPVEELAKRFAGEGVTMARDGMRLEL